MVSASSACTPSSPEASVSVPPEMVQLPFVCNASSAQSSVSVPPETSSVSPVFRPLALVVTSVASCAASGSAVSGGVPSEKPPSPRRHSVPRRLW